MSSVVGKLWKFHVYNEGWFDREAETDRAVGNQIKQQSTRFSASQSDCLPVDPLHVVGSLVFRVLRRVAVLHLLLFLRRHADHHWIWRLRSRLYIPAILRLDYFDSKALGYGSKFWKLPSHASCVGLVWKIFFKNHAVVLRLYAVQLVYAVVARLYRNKSNQSQYYRTVWWILGYSLLVANNFTET